VSRLTQAAQVDFMKWLRERKLSVAYISRVQSVIAAALNMAVAGDDDDDRALLNRSPRIIVQPPAVAAAIDAPEPVPRNWHPDIRSLARFLDAIPPAEQTRLMRFTILMLAFAARPEAIKELQPFQIDRRYRLVALNPPKRRQTKKHRPTLPVPALIWPLLETWSDADTIVHKDGHPVVVLRKPWKAVRQAAKLPETFTPYSLRHLMATELRRRRVPREQREMWMGHRRAAVNDAYGTFDPDYLADARDAVNALLGELAALCKVSPFRQVSAKRRLRLIGVEGKNI
jgi:integrase